ncbi:MAG: hypothetical protein M3P41_01790 [Actinomycetota bacterium]|nr:hypothetical protein [Actinomycetota bacterium]
MQKRLASLSVVRKPRKPANRLQQLMKRSKYDRRTNELFDKLDVGFVADWDDKPLTTGEAQRLYKARSIVQEQIRDFHRARDAIYLANHPDDLEFADALRKCIGDHEAFVRILKAAVPNDDQPRDDVGIQLLELLRAKAQRGELENAPKYDVAERPEQRPAPPGRRDGRTTLRSRTQPPRRNRVNAPHTVR